MQTFSGSKKRDKKKKIGLLLPSQFQIASGNTANLIHTPAFSTHSVTTKKHVATEKQHPSRNGSMHVCDVYKANTFDKQNGKSITSIDYHVAMIITLLDSFSRNKKEKIKVNLVLLFGIQLQGSEVCILILKANTKENLFKKNF